MEQQECPIVAFNELVRGRYKLRILWEVRERGYRFGALRRALVAAHGGKAVSARMLSRELKKLQAVALVHRSEVNGSRAVEYSITPRGYALMPVMRSICDWHAAERRRTTNGSRRRVAEPQLPARRTA